jgi:hypothetical protein
VSCHISFSSFGSTNRHCLLVAAWASSPRETVDQNPSDNIKNSTVDLSFTVSQKQKNKIPYQRCEGNGSEQSDQSNRSAVPT